MLVNAKEMLTKAKAGKYAVGQFNINNLEWTKAVLQTAEELKARGLWLVGADMAGDKTLFESDLTGAIALVVGSEGKGISRLLKEKCDFLVKIPMLGETESLNASVAAAVMMYEIVRQRSRQEN